MIRQLSSNLALLAHLRVLLKKSKMNSRVSPLMACPEKDDRVKSQMRCASRHKRSIFYGIMKAPFEYNCVLKFFYL
jgi:hypothetical protein